MFQAAEVTRHDPVRILRAWRLQRVAGTSLVTANTPWSPAMGLFLSTVMPASCAVAVWEGRRAVAVAQMARQSGRDQWEVMYLAVAGLRRDSSDADDAVSARLLPLLDEVCRLAGAQRIMGVVARVPEESCLVAPLRRAGFAVVTRERAFALSAPFSANAPDVPGLRLQEQRDAWPLHQLYLRTTPQNVRLAEGLTARDWQLRRGVPRLSFQATRWVVEDEGGLAGWLTESRGGGGTMRAQIGVAPGRRELARDLIATALRHARERGGAAVWSRTPAHAADVCQAFLDCGFSETEGGLALKRSLAVRAREPALARAKRGAARDGLTAVQYRPPAARHEAARPAVGGETGHRIRVS